MTMAPEYTFNDNGMPTLAKPWDFNLPEIPTFETAGGYRAKGELEILVDWVCKKHIIETGYGVSCEQIARDVTELDGRPTGSKPVWDILKRWTFMDYAMTAQQPNRFVGFTARGMELGLAELHRLEKRRAKREKDAKIRSVPMKRRKK